MNQPIDHTGTAEIVCPWCGALKIDKYIIQKSMPITDDLVRPWFETECDKCKTAFVFRENLTYTTQKNDANINREGKDVDTDNAGA